MRAPGSENYLRLRGIMRELKLNTVCEDAHCPNIGECWHHGTATFMILGDVCTRACTYCAVAHGRPATLDIDEPRRVGEAVEKMALKYAVITSVDRDDQADGGAGIFAETIREIKRRLPECRVEVLIPDFKGESKPLEIVLAAKPDVLNHNTETVPRLYRAVRSGGRYTRTLELRDRSRTLAPGIPTKTGMMMGLGEEHDEVIEGSRTSQVRRLNPGLDSICAIIQHAVMTRYTPYDYASEAVALGWDSSRRRRPFVALDHAQEQESAYRAYGASVRMF